MSGASLATAVDFAPLAGQPALIALGIGALVLLLLSARYQRRSLLPRGLATVLVFLILLNPSVGTQLRTPVPGVAVVVVDHSPSQDFGGRRTRTDAALAYLREKTSALPALELRVVDSAGGETGAARQTLLFGRLDQALADVPESRRAGVVMITDGQVHDVPSDPQGFAQYGPVNVLLSGDHVEHDRQLVIVEAPSYGIVGQDVQVKYRIEDPEAPRGTLLPLTVHQDNAAAQTLQLPANEDLTLTIHVAHAGQNILDMAAGAAPGELTFANNRVPIVVNGVRDRLRVLLVSGEPYAGTRTWRNLLTSDPGVDLVHFTIMRQPEKFDPTPQNDLSLVAFPFEELFQTKLYNFDLIIFDRYQLTRVLPPFYFANIARYVRDGGALLVTDGPQAPGESLYATPLADILSAPPTGRVLEQAFTPKITAIGNRHPVTQGLTLAGAESRRGDGQPWGEWLRQVAVTPGTDDEIVMTGADDLPLLMLTHVDKGRVAQLASDEIWLWSRGYKGGGPQGELLRRLAHWLMKEPELEENALDVTADDNGLLIRRHTLDVKPMTATITAPDGAKSEARLSPAPDGTLTARVPAPQLGVYVVSDGTQERFALVGAINPPELTGVRTTDEKLKPLVHASGGAFNWLADAPHPDVRFLPSGRHGFGGKGWLAFRDNQGYIVTGADNHPLLPAWIYLIALLAVLVGGWWYEGRR